MLYGIILNKPMWLFLLHHVPAENVGFNSCSWCIATNHNRLAISFFMNLSEGVKDDFYCSVYIIICLLFVEF
jgi:hypothetical protein